MRIPALSVKLSPTSMFLFCTLAGASTQLPAWAVMWFMAIGIFAACKACSLTALKVKLATIYRLIGYLFAWPGLDAKAFFAQRSISDDLRPTYLDWSRSIGNTAFGVGLLAFGVNRGADVSPVLAGWVGMTGIVFVLHFGTFALLSCAWRAAGIYAKPLMQQPLKSTSLADFWGRRWNTAFRDFAHRFLFRPLARRLGSRLGLLAGFLFSGVVHDVVISLPAGGGYGLPTMYFLIQAGGMIVEQTQRGARIGLGNGGGRASTMLVVAAPAPLLFHLPFIHEVVLPFLDAIGSL